MPDNFLMKSLRVRGRAFDDHIHFRSSNTIGAKALRGPRLTSTARLEFLSSCWELVLTDSGKLQPYQSYFRHYEEVCSYLPVSYPVLEDCTHEHFCQFVKTLHTGTRDACETNITKLLPFGCQSPEATKACIEFVGKAILLIDLSRWQATETLSDFVKRTIVTSSAQTDRYNIPISFNARAVEKIAGIKILWTRDLLDHLQIGSVNATLALFHNVKILHLYEQSSLRDIFPDNFLDETQRTLSLMLPLSDKACRSWFTSKQRKLKLDMAAGDCRNLRLAQRNIQDFNFWRDRLIIAKEAYDWSQPVGLLQFWRDDRNKVQWWTFWIAIVVFLFTLIGIIEGALQVYKAYYPA